MKSLQNTSFCSKIVSCSKITLVACLLNFSSLVIADTLSVPVGQQGQAVDLPRHGQSMQQTEVEFGQPIERIAAIGEPPITRWIYANFTIYFEHNKVIHSVIHTS